MPRAAKRSVPTPAAKSAKVSAATLRQLRAKAKTVRAQVAIDREQIAVEARAAVDDAVARGQLVKLTLILQMDEKPILEALDRYASNHGLKSRNQVLRAALAHLLDIDVGQPHWGWPAGKPRK